MNSLHKWNKLNGNIYKFNLIKTVVSKGYNCQYNELPSSLYGLSEGNYNLYDPCINIDFDE